MNIRTSSLTIFTSLFVMACGINQTELVKMPPHPQILQEQIVAQQELSVNKKASLTSQSAIVKNKHRAMISHQRMPSNVSSSTVYMPPQTELVNSDKFSTLIRNSIIKVSEQPVSTFSVDVDTGSYSVVRKYLNNGTLPPSNAVRIEELVNYFDYHYDQPKQSDTPFSVATQMIQTPWNEHTQLVQIGLQGYLPKQQRGPANLVFLMDVSGSMNAPDKLPLLKNAFKLLIKQLNEDDSVSIVVYAGASGVVLKPTAGDQRSDILQAINDLRAGGSTNGASGINLAYQLAQDSFIKGGINRVILATDGDFNVGTVDHNALIDLIKRKKESGIALTTLGFGSGNYNDHLMEQLANHGDGNYAYIDNLSEARKTLVGQISATLETIAKDVKIQVEWNPAQVSEYRLIGYENRLLNREDFNNDKVDAGDIGAGHTVTALYEISLVNSKHLAIDPLRYQAALSSVVDNQSKELAFVKLRYKNPKENNNAKSQLIQQPILSELALNGSDNELKFAASVAAFAQKLSGGQQINNFSYDDILKLARHTKGNDPHGYRGEFLKLVELAQSIDS